MSSSYHYLLKYVIAGEANVGKSTLIQKFTEETHRNTYVPSQRIHFASKTITVNELKVKCQLWDIAQPNESQGFKGLSDSLCRKAASILLLFDLTNRSTFEGLHRWAEDIRNKCQQQIAIVIVGNKADKQVRAVSQEEAEELAKTLDASYYEISSYDQKSIDSLFESISRGIVEQCTSSVNVTSSTLMSRIKKGKHAETPTSPSNSCNSQKPEEGFIATEEQQPKMIEESQQIFNIMDQMASSLKRTIHTQQFLKAVKANLKERGFQGISEIKTKYADKASQSSIIKELFDIFTIIEDSFVQTNFQFQRISIENNQLQKCKATEEDVKLEREKVEQLEKRIEVLTKEKTKLQQYKEQSGQRQQNLIQIMDKIKREKKQQSQKYQQLLFDYNKLQAKALSISKELSRYEQLQSQIKVQKLMQQRYDSELIEQLDSLQGTQINSQLIGKLKKKFSTRTESTILSSNFT